jgi:ribosomal protein S21
MATNITLKPRRNELPERLIKRFIKKVKKSGIIDEAREKRHYKKPSEKRREAKRRAIARQKKEMAKKKKN